MFFIHGKSKCEREVRFVSQRRHFAALGNCVFSGIKRVVYLSTQGHSRPFFYHRIFLYLLDRRFNQIGHCVYRSQIHSAVNGDWLTKTHFFLLFVNKVVEHGNLFYILLVVNRATTFYLDKSSKTQRAPIFHKIHTCLFLNVCLIFFWNIFSLL